MKMTSFRKDERYKDIKWIIFPDDKLKAVWDLLLTM